MTSTLVDRLRRVFTAVLHVDAPPATADLVDGGVLDSLALVELLAAIETEFAIEIPLDELDLERIRSLDRIAELVAERIAPTQPGAA